MWIKNSHGGSLRHDDLDVDRETALGIYVKKCAKFNVTAGITPTE